MNRDSKFVTWQPVLTDHIAFVYDSLSIQSGRPLVAYVVESEDSVRRAQGWTVTTDLSFERKAIPPDRFLRYCLAVLRSTRRDIHFFGSPFQNPKLILCLILASLLRIEFYLISEPYSPNSLGYLKEINPFVGRFKSLVRPLIYKIYGKILAKRIAGIFAISLLAVKQYSSAGFPISKIFRFGYFVPVVKISFLEFKTTPVLPVKIRVVFVGSLINRKGIDLLPGAIDSVREKGFSVTVDVYGPGDKNAVDSIGKNLKYCGIIPFGESGKTISQYDLLVVPSRFDGWGVVVNEALGVGVPVICSDATGAATLVTSFKAGLIFIEGDGRSLAEQLLKLFFNPGLLGSLRENALNSAKYLTPQIAAEYMINILSSNVENRCNIVPPWYGASN